MSNELVKTLNRTLTINSLDDLIKSKEADSGLAATNAALALDVSGSMGYPMRNGKQRIDGLRTVVDGIQKQRRGTQMIAFGGGEWEQVRVVTSVPAPAGGTPLAEAIDCARTMALERLVVISDGEPNDPSAALNAARAFGGRIDVVFVGDKGGAGEEFLRRLAESTGGTEFQGDLGEPKELTGKIMGLLDPAMVDDDDDE